jgi:hypothetical protein
MDRIIKSPHNLSYSEGVGLMAKAKAMDERKNDAILALAKDIARTPENQKWYPYNETVEVSVTREGPILFLNLFSNDKAHQDGNLKINLKDKSGLFTRVADKDLEPGVKNHYLFQTRNFIESAFVAFA